MESTRNGAQVLVEELLQSYQFYQPKNIDADCVDEETIPWGSSSLINDNYPDVYKKLVENSPTATSIIKNIVDFITCNLAGNDAKTGEEFKQVRHQMTTKKTDWSSTIGTLVKGVAEDVTLWGESFAIWVGFDQEELKKGQVVISQFKRIPFHWLRLAEIKEDLREYYGITDEFFISKRTCRASDKSAENDNEIYFQLNPRDDVEQILKQMKLISDLRKGEDSSLAELLPKNSTLKMGQILYMNSSDEQVYSNCIFDGMLQLMVADVGLDSGIASYLGSAKIAQSYQKNEASSGSEMMEQVLRPAVNQMFQGMLLTGDQIDRANRSLNDHYYASSMNAGNSTGANSSGVLAMGANIAVRIQDTESIQNFVYSTDCSKFMDEFKKMQTHIKEKLAERCQVDYGFIFKSENGVFNQDNVRAITEKMNLRFDKPRDMIEYAINDLILARSNFPFRISLKALGESKMSINEGVVK